MAGFDYLDVCRTSFQRIYFRITDSYGKAISLKNSHWYVSIIFQKSKDTTTWFIECIYSIQTK